MLTRIVLNCVHALAWGLAAAGGMASAANPFVSSIYTADPSAHVWADGRLYVYASHDIDPPRGCDLMDRYHVFSTDDLEEWRDEGEILRSSDVPWGRPEGGFMWAPDCAYRDGKYYFYYPHPSETAWNESWKVGVAVSTNPASGFTDVGFMTGVGGFAMIDPCVFVDTDGQAYFYYGGGSRCEAGKLQDNMVELDGPIQKMEGLADFHEAAWVFKREGVYYLTYADNHAGANRLRYAMSNSPLGPWSDKGIYLEPTGSDTSHGSVVEYKGQWYQFYHNCSISGRGNLRSICVDRLEFNPDGTIQQVVQTGSGPAAAPASDSGRHAATRYAVAAAVLGNAATLNDSPSAAEGRAVHNLDAPDAYLEFENIDGGENGGRAHVSFGYAALSKGKLRLRVNDVDHSFINTLPTGGWDTYAGRSGLTVDLAPGKSNRIRLVGGNGGVNVEWLEVSHLRQ